MAITFCKMVLYYAGIDGLKGYELKTKLAEIISRGHVDKKKIFRTLGYLQNCRYRPLL